MNMQTRRTRPRSFATWTPRPTSLELVQDVAATLDQAARLLDRESGLQANLVAGLGVRYD